MANSFEFDSTDLAGANYGLIVQRHAEPWIPTPDNDYQQVPQGPGVSQGINFGPRRIDLPCVVLGSSISNLFSKLDAIALLLDSRNGDKKLALDHISDRYWFGRLDSMLSAAYLGPTNRRLSLSFLCADPRAYSTTEDDDTFTIATDPDTFNIESATAVGGTTHAEPVFYIRNSTGGAVTSVALANTTLSETLTWSGSLDNGFWLAIATGENTSPAFMRNAVYKSTASGADPTALSYNLSMSGVADGSIFPRLKPNVQNAMSVTGISTGTVRWVYRARYL